MPPAERLPNDPETRIREATEAVAPRLIEIRRDVHTHPELAFQETRTAGIVAAELTRLGLTPRMLSHAVNSFSFVHLACSTKSEQSKRTTPRELAPFLDSR